MAESVALATRTATVVVQLVGRLAQMQVDGHLEMPLTELPAKIITAVVMV
jgi:hypothetical protein